MASNQRFLTVRDDDSMLGRIEFFRGRAYLHLQIRNRFQGFKAAKRIFPEVVAWLKRMGHRYVYVCIPDNDEMLYRFERSFGFEDEKRVGFIFMKQRT